MERERARFLVGAARGEGVRAHQHGVVQRLAVVGVAGLRLKLVGVHRAPATVDVGSVRGRTKDRGAVRAEGGRWVHLILTTFLAVVNLALIYLAKPIIMMVEARWPGR